MSDAVPTAESAVPGLRFETATSARHQARLAGMNPNYWYPAEWSHALRRGAVVEVSFWGESIAVFRGQDGRLGAMENRCAHRQIKLTEGHVRDCQLVCLYHGWSYDADARLVGMKHDDFGKRLPQIRLRSYPVRERYGLVWIFPGDPALAERVPLPEIPHYDGPDRWAHIRFDYTWEAQHYMVIDNLCNLTHLYVHGNWVPYRDTVLADHGLEHGERIHLRWQHTLRRRDPLYPIYKLLFTPDLRSDESDTRMVYDYPYQRALSNGRIRSCNFMLPCTPSRTRVFTIQLWKSFGFEGGVRVPPSVMQQTWARVIRPYTREIFRQDGATVEAEQMALREHWQKPYPEPNPSVRLFEKVTIDRWRSHLDQQAGRLPLAAAAAPTDRVKRL